MYNQLQAKALKWIVKLNALLQEYKQPPLKIHKLNECREIKKNPLIKRRLNVKYCMKIRAYQLQIGDIFETKHNICMITSIEHQKRINGSAFSYITRQPIRYIFSRNQIIQIYSQNQIDPRD